MTRQAERRRGARRRTALRALLSSGEWLIDPEGLASLVAGTAQAPGLAETVTGGRVAVMTIQGGMAARANEVTEYFGIPTYERIGQTLSALVAREDVGGIVLDLNTPGGQVAGLPELAADVRRMALVKPIVALANPLAASAGLWLGSAATRFLVSPSGEVGSHGVLWTHGNYAKLYERVGIEVSLITSAKKKVEMSPFGPLSDEARAHAQERVDALHQEFTAALAFYRDVTREAVAADWGQGRMVRAADAVRVGMVDGIRTLPEAVAELAAAIGESGRRGFSGGAGGGVRFGGAGITRPVSCEGDAMFKLGSRARQILVQRGYATEAAGDRDLHSQVMTMATARGLVPPADADEAERMLVQIFDVVAEGNPHTPPAAAGELSVTLTSGAVSPPPGGVSAPPPGGAAGALVAAPASPAAAVPPISAPPVGAAPNVAAALVPATPAPQPAAGVSVADIVGIVALAGLPADRALSLQTELVTRPPASHQELTQRVSAVAQQVRAPVGPGADVNPLAAVRAVQVAESDKLRTAITSQILGGGYAGTPPREIYDHRTRQMSAFRLDTSIPQLRTFDAVAGFAAHRAGVSYETWNNLSVVDKASVMAGQQVWGVSAEQAANVRAMYANVFFDATDIKARQGYAEAPATYERWAKRDTPFADFKKRYSTILGELPDPKVLTELEEFEDTTTTDAKEDWTIDIWAQAFGMSYQMQVGDTFGRFLELPQMAGRAFRRKENKLVYGHLMRNPTLSADSTALFAARTGRVNTRASQGAVTEANFETVINDFQSMKGLSTEADATLGLQPRYVLVPRARYLEAWKLLMSPTETGTTNSLIPNPFQNKYEIIEDYELQTASGNAGALDTTWYAVCDRADVAGMLYAGLEGAEVLRTEQIQFVNTLGMRFRMWKTFGCKAVDFRAFQRRTA